MVKGSASTAGLHLGAGDDGASSKLDPEAQEEEQEEELDDEPQEWHELGDEERTANSMLGWDQAMWTASQSDDSVAPGTYEKAWTELSADERNAAVVLGYDADGEQWTTEHDEVDDY